MKQRKDARRRLFTAAVCRAAWTRGFVLPTEPHASTMLTSLARNWKLLQWLKVRCQYTCSCYGVVVSPLHEIIAREIPIALHLVSALVTDVCTPHGEGGYLEVPQSR